MLLNRFALMNFSYQVPAKSMMFSGRHRVSTLIQPAASQATFSTRQAAADDAEEVEIVVGAGGDTRSFRRNSDLEFQNWLKKDLSTSKPKQVDWKRKKRSVFAKIGYNANHIPHQGNYPKDKKKERLAQWDNPKYDWPPRLPRPTMHLGKTLLNHIDSEERQRI